MNTLHGTAETIEDEGTSSEEMGFYEPVVDSEDLEFHGDTILEPFDNDTWIEPESTASEPLEASALDVAAYILKKTGTMSTMKLQKLVYYGQAWSLVWDEAPLFAEDIEAWANGPVVRELFDYHRGMYQISEVLTGNPRVLSKIQQESVDAVLEYYKDRPAQSLIELSHCEAPWIEARKGLPPLVRGNKIIPLDSIANYYSSLAVSENEDNEEPRS